jgi:hypothetical protein
MNDIVELLQFKTFGQDSFPISISIEIVSSQKRGSYYDHRKFVVFFNVRAGGGLCEYRLFKQAELRISELSIA